MLFSSFYFLINNFLSVSKMLPCDLGRNLEFHLIMIRIFLILITVVSVKFKNT